MEKIVLEHKIAERGRLRDVTNKIGVFGRVLTSPAHALSSVLVPEHALQLRNDGNVGVDLRWLSISLETRSTAIRTMGRVSMFASE